MQSFDETNYSNSKDSIVQVKNYLLLVSKIKKTSFQNECKMLFIGCKVGPFSVI